MQKVEICGVDTAGLPKLTAQENETLMLELKAGDAQAREKFIVGNMRLVLSLTKRFRAKNAQADDLFQAGCVGLIKAIDNFDVSVGVKFSTYAVPITFARRNFPLPTEDEIINEYQRTTAAYPQSRRIAGDYAA